MTGVEARATIEAELRRELFGPVSGEKPWGKPLEVGGGSIHFQSVEESRGQFHENEI